MLQDVPKLEEKLPGIRELAKTYVNKDPLVDPLPVVPTQHYMMGGIPTNRYGEVIHFMGETENIIKGLYAVGECACVSIHGANRLGGNSLIDLVVFGKAVGERIVENARSCSSSKVPTIEASKERYDYLMSSTRGPSVASLRNKMKNVMSECFGVFRNGKDMKRGLEALELIYKQVQKCRLDDHSKVFNTALVEAFELENLLICALMTARSAYVRNETRGAHSRVDFSERDDENWHVHNIAYLSGETHKRPVNMAPINCETVALDQRN